MSNKKTTETSESFIVQNIAPGPLCISDLKRSFGPFEVQDLTYEQKERILSSRDLKVALMKGLLRKITREDWDVIEKRKIEDERQELQHQQNTRKRLQSVNIDGKMVDTEILDLTGADALNDAQKEVATSGHVNDSATYATAYANASAAAQLHGRDLDPREFYNMVQANPGLIKQYVHGDIGSVSGSSQRGRATVITAPSNYEEGTNISQFNMSNLNRDGHLAGYGGDVQLDLSQNASETIDLAGDIDEIDLSAEVNAMDGDGIRRV